LSERFRLGLRERVRFWWQIVTWFAPLFVIQAYGRFWKSGIMYISILSLCLWKGEALNTKNFNINNVETVADSPGDRKRTPLSKIQLAH
jgi:hypothetical protein